MRMHIARAVGIAAAALALATTAQAQGRGHGHGGEHGEHGEHGRANGDIEPRGREVPPGLAKKPGQMPPGQYKKLYASDGANVLDEVLRRHGYVVNRIIPVGTSRYVYYRAPNGTIWRRAIVSPGTSRLGFANVPAAILQEVLNLLY